MKFRYLWIPFQLNDLNFRIFAIYYFFEFCHVAETFRGSVVIRIHFFGFEFEYCIGRLFHAHCIGQVHRNESHVNVL